LSGIPCGQNLLSFGQTTANPNSQEPTKPDTCLASCVLLQATVQSIVHGDCLTRCEQVMPMKGNIPFPAADPIPSPFPLKSLPADATFADVLKLYSFGSESLATWLPSALQCLFTLHKLPSLTKNGKHVDNIFNLEEADPQWPKILNLLSVYGISLFWDSPSEVSSCLSALLANVCKMPAKLKLI
jgi:hypothetical protein